MSNQSLFAWKTRKVESTIRRLRGMPHLHGVFWLNKEEIEHCIDEDGEYKDKEITEVIDNWVSCSLNTGSEPLDNLVKEVNVHGHTHTCYKGKSPNCRFLQG